MTDTHNNTSTCSSQVDVNKPLIATVADQYAVNPGGNVNTIYLGYGPTSLTYTAVVAASPNNGTPGYTYVWKRVSPAPATLGSSASLTVNPSVVGTYIYSVTVTDSRGCSTTVNKTVIVSDPRDGAKMFVCHNGNTLSIALSAVPAHLAIGDYLGKCVTPPVARSSAGGIKPVEIMDELFTVNVHPNPSTTDFRIYIESSSNEPISIHIMDGMGKAITNLSEVQKHSWVTLGANYSKGIYFAEVIQGLKHKTVKLVKLD